MGACVRGQLPAKNPGGERATTQVDRRASLGARFLGLSDGPGFPAGFFVRFGRRCRLYVGKIMIDDAELLRRYVANRSEEAFAELVRRHVDLVYSVALRQVGGDVHLAQDVAQVVFTALARKAASLANRPVLAGWLYRTAQFSAIDVVRAEHRRRQREETAYAMNDLTNHSGATVDWEKLRPSLDQAIGELGDEDRDAVVLRFFQGQPFAEIGARLKITENGARMRVERALAKLHGLLAQRGLTSTTAALGIALGNQIGVAAPAGLAATVAGAAMSAVTSGGGTAAAVGAYLTMSKIKVGIAGALVAGVLAIGTMELQANRELKAELSRPSPEKEAPLALRTENRALNATLGKLAADNPEVKELTALRNRAAQLRARPPGVVDSELKPISSWVNRGWATPEAALETVMWAASIGNHEELVKNAPFVGDAKAKADAAFAALPEVVRLRYQTADRLLGAVCFGTRGAVDDAAARAAYGGEVVAFQVLDTSVDYKRSGISVRWWEQLSTGEEREKKQTFVQDGDHFTLGENRFTAGTWEWIVSEIDLTTGELLPRKLPPSPAK
jgi:RNA polymerase sigma factor (sigma-70 family)